MDVEFSSGLSLHVEAWEGCYLIARMLALLLLLSRLAGRYSLPAQENLPEAMPGLFSLMRAFSTACI
jgi:hypothetical protein